MGRAGKISWLPRRSICHVDVAPNLDGASALPGASDVIGRLHPHERVHLDAEGLFDAQGHVAGKVGVAVEQVRQGRPGDAKNLGGRFYRKTFRGNDLRSDKSPGCGGLSIRMVFLL